SQRAACVYRLGAGASERTFDPLLPVERRMTSHPSFLATALQQGERGCRPGSAPGRRPKKSQVRRQIKTAKTYCRGRIWVTLATMVWMSLSFKSPLAKA